MNAKKYIRYVVGGASIMIGAGLVITGFFGYLGPQVAEPITTGVGIIFQLIGFFIFFFGLALIGINPRKISKDAKGSVKDVPVINDATSLIDEVVS